MRRLFAICLLLSVAAALGNACSGDAEITVTATPAPATSTATAIAEPATAQVAAPTSTPAATPVPTIASPEIGREAVVEDPYEIVGQTYSACASMADTACLDRIVAEAMTSTPAEAFWLEYQAFLAGFEEHGAVDFGAVSSPLYNMARPEPVFLNGDFGLIYLGEVVPSDWQTAPAYADMTDAVSWVEYAHLVEAGASGGSQVFRLEIPLQVCRACPTLGYLNLEVRFEAGGLAGVEVLAMTEVSPTPNP